MIVTLTVYYKHVPLHTATVDDGRALPCQASLRYYVEPVVRRMKILAN